MEKIWFIIVFSMRLAILVYVPCWINPSPTWNSRYPHEILGTRKLRQRQDGWQRLARCWWIFVPLWTFQGAQHLSPAVAGCQLIIIFRCHKGLQNLNQTEPWGFLKWGYIFCIETHGFGDSPIKHINVKVFAQVVRIWRFRWCSLVIAETPGNHQPSWRKDFSFRGTSLVRYEELCSFSSSPKRWQSKSTLK